MRLINNDCVKIIIRELAETFFPHHRLHGSNRHTEPAAKAALFRFFRGASQTGNLTQFIRRLLKQLPSVRQNQHTAALTHTFFCYLCKNDRFPAAGRQYQQRLIYGLPLRKDRIFCFLLIWTEFHQNTPAL